MKTIKIITTGGTIDKFYYDRKDDFKIGDPQIESVLQEARVTAPYGILSLMRKDSLNIVDQDRELIKETIRAEATTKIIVTHGTDTMVATASYVAGIPGKTIVFTGALQPARFKMSDAVFNIGMAIAAVQTLPEGVYIVMNGKVFHHDNVRKNLERNCFERLTP